MSDLVVGPPALPPLAHYQGGRIDYAILQPAQQCSLAHGEQTRNRGIGQSISGDTVYDHS